MKTLLLAGIHSASSRWKLRLVLRVLLLVCAASSAGVLGSTETLAQNAYITNNDLNSGAGDVSVIDTHSSAVIATIPVLPSGFAPAGVAVTSDGSKAYIADESRRHLSDRHRD